MEPVATVDQAWTQERRALLEWFRVQAPALGALYEAAVRLIAQPGSPARLHLVSHLAREIANRLPEAITGQRLGKRFETEKMLAKVSERWASETPESAVEAPTVPLSATLVRELSQLFRDHRAVAETNRDKTALLIDALRPGSAALRPAMEPVLRDWEAVVRWFVSHTHASAEGREHAVPEFELQRQFRHFEDGLRGITEGHFRVVREIDAVLQTSEPGAATLDSLMPFLGGPEQLRYFFAHPRLDDARWIPALAERRFFAQPPEPVVDETDGSELHVRWPASGYLARMAGRTDAQELVVAIATSLRTRNTIVRDDLLAIAAALPSTLAARVVPTLLASLEGTRWHHAQLARLGEVVVSLAAGGQHEAALQLLEAILSAYVREGPGANIGHVPAHRLGLMFREHLEGIVSALGLTVLYTLCRFLDRAIRLRRARSIEDGPEDHSHIWRPRLEGHGGEEQADDVLASAVMMASSQMAGDPARLDQVLDTLARCRYRVAARIALYLLSRQPDRAPDRVAAFLLNRELYDARSVRREYGMLLERGFRLLSPEQQFSWLAWIEDSLPVEAAREILKFLGQPVEHEKVARLQRERQWERLSPARHDLPAPWAERWAALEREFGPPPPTDHVEYAWSVGVVRFESPIGGERLAAMAVPELVDALKNVTFPPEKPFSTPRGLADVLTGVVAASPQRYATEVASFAGLAPTYVRALVDGLSRALRDHVPFEWDGMLTLASWVFEQPVEASTPAYTLAHDEGWGWTRGAIVGLLKTALEQDPSPLAAAERPRVKAILEAACADPNPERAEDGLEAALYYAVWINRREHGRWSGAGTLDSIPEVRALFDRAVDAGTPRLHGAAASWLPSFMSMDPAWARSLVPRLFPDDPGRHECRHAALVSHLRNKAPHDELFTLLAPVYARGVAELDPSTPGHDGLESPERNLAEHLVFLYGWGVLERSGRTDLIDAFFERASAGLRRHFHWCIGRILADDGPAVEPEVIRRFTTLWQERRKRAATDARAKDEMPSFGIWFRSPRLAPEWLLGELESVLQLVGGIDYDDITVDRLAALSAEHPMAVVGCFERLATQVRDPGYVHGWLDAVPTILGAGIRHPDPATRAKAIRAFHALGALGFRAPQLVPFSDDLDDAAAIPYFTWDDPMTVGEIHTRLETASRPERDRLLALILREAKDTDVWRFTSPQEVLDRWEDLEPHLGRKRGFWQVLLQSWKEQGLLAR